MKKSILLGFLLFTVALFATIPSYNWHVYPTHLSYSMYDYMNGAYNGFPVRIQEEDISSRGIYATFMASNVYGQQRRQLYSFMDMHGNVQSQGPLSNMHIFEGFGTLTIDPVSGNPFFVWHSMYEQDLTHNNFTYDVFSFSNSGGNAIQDHNIMLQNDLNDAMHHYIWPVIYIGDSPVSGKRRAYVFTLNSRNANQGTASSSVTMSFTDFNTSDIEMATPSNFVWVHQRLPYLIDLHNWIPSNPEGDFAQAHPSFTVKDNKVAIAGQVFGNTTEWSGMFEHDAFVLYSDNYGESFSVTGLNLERHLPQGEKPKAYYNGQTIYPHLVDADNIFMRQSILNHKTIAFDNDGRLHIPATFSIHWADAESANQFYRLPLSNSVINVIYDPESETHQFSQIWPRADYPLTDELLMVWDLNNDGWIDDFIPVQDETATWYAIDWFTENWPVFHYSLENQFHYNQVRMSEFNEYGDAAMMWMDGTKAYKYHQEGNEDYWHYSNVPEIMISLTNSSGQYWTEPIRLNIHNHPELGYIPSYVYPADKIIRIDSETVRLYFMYVSDNAYGSSIHSDGPGNGAEIKFASLDIYLDNTFTPNHFNPVWSGNGYQHMNFYALEASIFGEDLEIGDEIGIFDGEYCVGAVKISYEHLYAPYIPIITSQDDPYTTEVDGFTPGNTVTFKVWKRAMQTEYTAPLLNIQYISGTPVFASNASATVKINTGDLVLQSIPMIAGWNIMSARAIGEETDMLDVFSQFIETGSLSKIQNQSGQAVELLGNEWINNIGDLELTQGYRVRLNNNSVLGIFGNQAELPMDISLTEGWNLISFPYSYPDWSEYILYELIQSNILLKVIDEQGNAIENLNFIGWINHIGYFLPGKGYAVRVNEDCVLTYGDYRSGINFDMNTIVRTNTNTQHFQRVWQGNGWQHFNVYLKINDELLQNISIGDEIAVYDNDICVGVAVYSGEEEYITITTSMIDNTVQEPNGFRPNENFSLRFYNSSTQTEVIDSYIEILDGNNVFTANGSAVVSLNQFTSNTDMVVPTTTGINAIYPNPFNPDTNIRFSLNKPGEIKLEIYNVKGQRIKTLVQGHHNAGIYQVNWNGLDNNNKKVSSGIYFTRLVTSEKQDVKKMVLIK